MKEFYESLIRPTAAGLDDLMNYPIHYIPISSTYPEDKEDRCAHEDMTWVHQAIEIHKGTRTLIANPFCNDCDRYVSDMD